MTLPVFVDTGGWFAYFVRRDPDHTAAVNWMRQNRLPLVTTDYSLKVENLPKAPPPKGQMDLLSLKTD